MIDWISRAHTERERKWIEMWKLRDEPTVMEKRRDIVMLTMRLNEFYPSPKPKDTKLNLQNCGINFVWACFFCWIQFALRRKCSTWFLHCLYKTKHTALPVLSLPLEMMCIFLKALNILHVFPSFDLHNSFYLSIYSSNERALIRWTTWHVIIFRSLFHDGVRSVEEKRETFNYLCTLNTIHFPFIILLHSIAMRRNEEEKGQPSNVKTNSKKLRKKNSSNFFHSAKIRANETHGTFYTEYIP